MTTPRYQRSQKILKVMTEAAMSFNYHFKVKRKKTKLNEDPADRKNISTKGMRLVF